MAQKKKPETGIPTNIPSTIEEVITRTCEVTVHTLRQREIRSILRNKFTNTELLLKNYHLFASHYDEAVDNISRVRDIVDTSKLNSDELFIESIRRSKGKTMIMIAHINAALDALRTNLAEKNQPERYRIIEGLFLNRNPLSVEDLAEELDCSERSIQRYKKELIHELSILIFGIEAIEAKLSEWCR